jgi:DNA-binding GntR family transcriptional regulator
VSEAETTNETRDTILTKVSRPRTATDHVSTSLRHSILTGDLAGGTRLGLNQVAEIFDVSTTPVREALRELSFEGLVRLDSYRGGVVTAVSRKDVEEIVRIRQVLEPMAIEEAVAGMTEQILVDARRILDDMASSEGWDAWIHGNRAFHQKLYEASSSRRLISLIKSLQDTQVVFVSSTLRRSPTLKETATADHEAMLQAARDCDARTLTEVTLRHLTIPVRD